MLPLRKQDKDLPETLPEPIYGIHHKKQEKCALVHLAKQWSHLPVINRTTHINITHPEITKIEMCLSNNAKWEFPIGVEVRAARLTH